MTSAGLTFGIYPLGVAGTPTGLAIGPEDDYGKITEALHQLRGDSKTLTPRAYLVYTRSDAEAGLFSFADRLFHSGLLGNLVIGWIQTADIVIDKWLGFIREIVRKYGPYLSSLQITNEPNLLFMEGSKSYTRQALVQGVIAAKQQARKCGYPIKIGFGSVPESPASVPHFWEGFVELKDKAFVNSVDFVGHNFYVDVFEEPLELTEITASVERILHNLRKNLAAAGIPDSVPIRVTENGWPTGENPFTRTERTYDQQAVVLETLIRTVYRLREEFRITHYELFGLRDADSSKPDLFHQFGIMRDDYSPKLAFSVVQRLIQELGN